MEKSCRYVVNAVGKGGETYFTHFQDKQELKTWLKDHQDKINMKDIKINDKKMNSLLKTLTFLNILK
ncbi:hypothetical protein [Bacillus sp. AFS040349]|uniref:hypothetical protein n=1 Tax=Bacillus sp. AFS040349 TaxID=2033502 RepID=UPI000BFE9C04|nr:hypothetical protein [Bacillus sp. AFS040349]PGT80289.1 hypothetical protein COD11_21460 [Bacillus sp. AFS040349]